MWTTTTTTAASVALVTAVSMVPAPQEAAVSIAGAETARDRAALPCDGLVLQRPARCPAAGRSEAENRRKIDLPAEARSVPSRPLMNVTITG